MELENFIYGQLRGTRGRHKWATLAILFSWTEELGFNSSMA